MTFSKITCLVLWTLLHFTSSNVSFCTAHALVTGGSNANSRGENSFSKVATQASYHLQLHNSPRNVSDYPTEELKEKRRRVKDEQWENDKRLKAFNLYGSQSNNTVHYSKDGELGQDYFVMEICMLVDSVLEQAITDSGNNLLDYIHTFIHTVNYMYENSHSQDDSFPTLKMKVVQVDVLREDLEPLIFHNDEGVEDIELTLKYFRKYAKKLKLDKYDHTMLLTGRDMYRKVGDQYEPDVLGVAFFNGTCTKYSSHEKKYNAVSIVEDVGARHLGVYAATHELAHNLGVKHDSKAAGTPYECHAKRGYIMSPVTERTDNMYQFSECSLASLRTFLHSEHGKCLSQGHLKPVYPDDLIAKFPGDLYTMETICKHFADLNFGNEVYYNVEVNKGRGPSFLCKQISCKVEIPSGKVFTLEPPFAPGENIECGDGKVCKSGNCV